MVAQLNFYTFSPTYSKPSTDDQKPQLSLHGVVNSWVAGHINDH